MIGALVRRRRVALGLTQVELGRRTGLSQNYVSKLEKGRVDLPQRGTLEALAGALSLPVADFYRAAGILQEADEAEPEDPLPRVVVVHGPNGEQEVPIARVVAYVESFPNERHQARLERWRATHDAATYARLCARVFVAWSSNYELLLDALDTVGIG